MLALAPLDVVAASAFHCCGAATTSKGARRDHLQRSSLSHSDALCKAESVVAKCVLQSLQPLQSFGNRNTYLHQSAFIVVSGCGSVLRYSSCSSLLFDSTRLALDRCRSQACQAGCLSGAQGLRHAGES